MSINARLKEYLGIGYAVFSFLSGLTFLYACFSGLVYLINLNPPRGILTIVFWVLAVPFWIAKFFEYDKEKSKSKS